jgi:hypothetical protein
MEKTTIVFIILVLLLLLAGYVSVESFVDASDNSGVKLNLSLTDLISLFASSKSKTDKGATDEDVKNDDEYKKLKAYKDSMESQLDQQFYSDLKTQILTDVRDTVRTELKGSPLTKQTEDSSCGMVSDDCINSFVSKQSSDFMKYIPGKNPSDYIRKDSIPCYACNLS